MADSAGAEVSAGEDVGVDDDAAGLVTELLGAVSGSEAEQPLSATAHAARAAIAGEDFNTSLRFTAHRPSDSLRCTKTLVAIHHSEDGKKSPQHEYCHLEIAQTA